MPGVVHSLHCSVCACALFMKCVGLCQRVRFNMSLDECLSNGSVPNDDGGWRGDLLLGRVIGSSGHCVPSSLSVLRASLLALGVIYLLTSKPPRVALFSSSQLSPDDSRTTLGR